MNIKKLNEMSDEAIINVIFLFFFIMSICGYYLTLGDGRLISLIKLFHYTFFDYVKFGLVYIALSAITYPFMHVAFEIKNKKKCLLISCIAPPILFGFALCIIMIMFTICG